MLGLYYDQVWIMAVMLRCGTDEGVPYNQRWFNEVAQPKASEKLKSYHSPIRLFVSYEHLFALEHTKRIFTAHPQHLHLRDPIPCLPRPPSGFCEFPSSPMTKESSRRVPIVSSVSERFISYRNTGIPPRPDCRFPAHWKRRF